MNSAELREWVLPLVHSLAWPLLILVLALILRPHIGRLIGLIRTIRYKDLELSLSETVEEATSRAQALESADDPALDIPSPTPSDVDPRITILNSWASVEATVRNLAEANQEAIGRATERMSTRRRIQLLTQIGIVDSPLAAALEDLRVVRNLVAHGEDIRMDNDALVGFSRAAIRLESIMEQRIY